MAKILVGKIGLDGHDRGAKLISKYLKERGFEVVYSGIRNTPESLVRIALHEDVDIIGVSILSGAHNSLIAKLLNELEKHELQLPVIVGGIIPANDVEYLHSIGVKKVFHNINSLKDIEEYLHEFK